MKRLFTILLATMLAGQTWASKYYDFSAECSSGQTLYYRITSDSTVSITFPNRNLLETDYYYNYNMPIGAMEIPNIVTYNDVEYAVTTISNYAFIGCSSLSSVTIPESVTSIGDNAFAKCDGLTTITIHNSVTTIGKSAFIDCTRLASVTIPESVTYIGESAFCNCGGLNSVTIGNGVAKIGNRAFYGCSLDYTAYDNAFYIGNSENPYLVLMEAKNKKIELCEINRRCRFIHGDAFKDCRSLTEITIPDSVISIGNNAFEDCYGLHKSEFASIANLCKIEFGNEYANPIYYTNHFLINGDEVSDVVIPDTITSIGSYAFYHSCLTSIKIPESVTQIGSSAFGGEKYGSSYTSSLLKAEFASIESLCNIIFGNKDANPLYCANNLYIDGELVVNLVIPETVKSIGNYTFNGCTSIVSLYISDSVRSIGNSAFVGCGRLASIEIPNSVVSIGNNAFLDCNGLKSLSYNSNAVGSHFNNNSALESIFIGDSIKSIVGTEFNGCDNLVNVISMAAVPPTLNGDPYTFADTIWVPAASVDAYKAAPVWKRKEIMPLDYYKVSVVNTDTARGSVSGNGNFAAKQAVTIYATPAEHYSFKAWSDGNTENPRTIMLNADVNLTAVFEGEECTISTQNSDFGSVVGGGTYHFGDTVTITATGVKGYHFVMWNDSVTTNPRTMIVTDNSSFSALFEIDTYTIAATAENGEVSGAAQYNYGESVTLTATVKDGYHFTMWSDSVTANPRTFTAECDLDITAIIEAHTVVVDSAVAATCTETGLTEGSHCSVCKAILVAQDTIDALGHTEVMDAAVAATCTESGLTAGKHCSVCDEVLVVQETIAALGHTEVVDAAVAATCTESGLTEGKHCSVCNEVLVKQDTIAALGHTEVVDAAVAATCTKTGLTAGKHCTVCEAVLVVQDTIEALGHTEVVDASVAATCTESGLTEGKHCSVCNEELVAQTEIPALGHQFVNYVYNNDATTTADGTETAVCEHGCGATDTRVKEGTKLHTAVSESAADKLLVYAHGNTIVVENATEEIRVYNAMGKLVCRDAIHRVRAEITVNTAGVYIVKTGNVAMRVVVE